MAKSAANYANSALIKMEAIADGYAEGIALDVSGNISEGSGQNIFIVRDGIIYTPPLGSSILGGITRDSVMTLARDLGYTVSESMHPARGALHRRRGVLRRHRRRSHADPVGRQDQQIGTGRRGPITEALQQAFFDVINGEVPDTHGWLTYVYPDEAPLRSARREPRRPGASAEARCETDMHVNDLLKIAVDERRVRPPPEGRQLPDDARPRHAGAGHRGEEARSRGRRRDGRGGDVDDAAPEVQGVAGSRPRLQRARARPLPLQRLPAARHRRPGAARHPDADPDDRRARAAAGAEDDRRGRARPGAGHRHHRQRQEHDARGDDRLHQHDARPRT